MSKEKSEDLTKELNQESEQEISTNESFQEKKDGLVDIMVKEEVSFFYGGIDYKLEKGKIYKVDLVIKDLLKKAGYLVVI
jgi:hypothetical protein